MKSTIVFAVLFLLVIGLVSALTYNHDWKYPIRDSFYPDKELNFGSVSQDTQAKMYNYMWLVHHDLVDASDSEIVAYKKFHYQGSVGKMDKSRYSKTAYKENKGYDFSGSLSVKHQKGFKKSYRNSDCWN